MKDFVLTAVLVILVGGAAWYIYRAKKRGQKCIGCPDSGTCSGHCGACSGKCGGCKGHKSI